MSRISSEKRPITNVETLNSDNLLNSVEPIEKMMEMSECFYEPIRIKTVCDEFSKADISDLCFYRVSKLSFDEDFPRREAFENVLTALDSPDFNFVYILDGSPKEVVLYLGIVKNYNSSVTSLNANDIGSNLESLIKGNFGGSELYRLNKEELETCISPSKKFDYKSGGFIVGIPSENKDNFDNRGLDFQGVDRLINSMSDSHWRLVVVVENVNRTKIKSIIDRTYTIYDSVSPLSKQSLQKGISVGTSKQNSDTKGDSSSESETRSKSESGGSSDSDSGSGHSTNKGNSKTEQKSSTTSNSSSTTESSGENSSKSISSTSEVICKRAQEIIRYMDEELLERLKVGYSKGVFNVSVRYMAKDRKTANRLKNAVISLFQGERSTFSPLVAYDLDLSEVNNKNVFLNFRNCTVSLKYFSESERNLAHLLGRPLSENEKEIYLSTYLTTKETALFVGFPQKEVPGIPLIKGVEFGLNIARKDGFNSEIQENDRISIGSIYNKARELKGNIFSLTLNSLKKHMFIAGVTGSGKTTTCQKLLEEIDDHNIPFIVIEPAKTEYRSLLNKFKNLTVFTSGKETCAPLRINPFQLMKGENISSHIDMIRAAFTASFRMEASMPQLLEEAIYRCYEKKGWDIINNCHLIYDDETAFDGTHNDLFPTLSMLTQMFSEVTNEKHFGDRLGSEYIGSLVSRLSNLTVGVKGAMLDCPVGIDFSDLIQKQVVIEMEEMRSPDDKALLMGFILTLMSVAVKQQYSKNRKFEHITFVEEAHRLLSKPDFGEENSRKAAVETFVDMLAEIRKYGEGLVIIDQIPNKLASEVLKNTNTKIIHKLFAKDDKDAVGDTMLMDDKQREFLSSMMPGHAVVFSEGMDKPVHIRVSKIEDDRISEDISDDDIHKRFNDKCKEFRGMEDLDYKKGLSGLVKEYTRLMNLVCENLPKGSVDILNETFEKSTEDAKILVENLNKLDRRYHKSQGTSLKEIIRLYNQKSNHKKTSCKTSVKDIDEAEEACSLNEEMFKRWGKGLMKFDKEEFDDWKNNPLKENNCRYMKLARMYSRLTN